MQPALATTWPRTFGRICGRKIVCRNAFSSSPYDVIPTAAGDTNLASAREGSKARIEEGSQDLAHPIGAEVEAKHPRGVPHALDHVTPHAGDVNKFWLGPFQGLCEQCHNGAKKFEENRGYLPDFGLGGFPIEPRHPANTPRRV